MEYAHCAYFSLYDSGFLNAHILKTKLQMMELTAQQV